MGCASGILGCSKSSAGSWVIPSFSMTRREALFAGTVKETSSGIPKVSKA
jgi:hypothetical protein